jgi:hypothetical protein
MRPLQAHLPDPSIYSAAAQLARVVGQQGAEQTPPAREQSVGEYAREAQGILDAHWVAAGYRWDDDDPHQRFEQDLATLGEGWREAARALVEQLGAFCAFCETPLTAAPRPVQILPLARFPTAAFDFANLLLACPVCAALKGDRPDQQTVRQDTATAARTLLDPKVFAWPSLYWSGLGATAVLPFRYDLVVVRRDGDTIERVRLVLPTEYPGLVAAWREGRLVEDAALLKLEDQGGGSAVAIAAHLAPSGSDAGLRAGVQAIIDLFQLNQVAVGLRGAPLDRRVALRTRTFLEALGAREALDVVARNAAGIPSDDLEQTLGPGVAATGFWGVWLTVLAGLPGIEGLLAKVFPGLPPTRWIL